MTHRLLLAEFWDRMTHVTRRTRTTRRSQPKSTIMEHTKNQILTHRRFLPTVSFGPKIFCGPKIDFGPKILWTQHIFGDPKFFWTQTFLDLKFFWSQNFFWIQIFQTQNFSDPKWTSTKIIFGGIKQSFWTWGFPNCLAQRFYLNWSLTLKTKSC